MKKIGLVLFMIVGLTFLLFPEVASYTSYESERTEINRGLNLADSLRLWVGDGLKVDGSLAITAPAEDFKIGQAPVYDISGIQYTRQALDSISFTAADTVNTAADSTAFWGIWLVQINAAGTISTKSPATNQVYSDSLTAIAALPAPDASNVRLGYILIENNSGSSWVANTDDMTPTSDCKNSVFEDYPVKVFPAGE
jgi:hypothetical protein